MSRRGLLLVLLSAWLGASCAGARRPGAAAAGDEASPAGPLRLIAGLSPRGGGRGWKALRRRVEARLPRLAEQPFELRIQGGPRLWVRHLGAGPAPAIERAGRVVYDEVTPGVSSTFEAREDGVEQTFVLERSGLVAEQELSLPPGYGLRLAAPGLVEVRDGAGRARGRVRAEAAWDCQRRPAELRLSLRGQRLRYEVEGVGCWPAVIDPLWTSTDQMAFARTGHAAATLGDGRVLIAGGGETIGPAEVFDPQLGTFSLSGELRAGRTDPRSTVLLDGRVLLWGGRSLYNGIEQKSGPVDGEVFEPRSGSFASTAVGTGRPGRITLLRSGQVMLWTGEALDPASLRVQQLSLVGPPCLVEEAALLDEDSVFVQSLYGASCLFSPQAPAYQDLGIGGGRRGGAMALLPSGNALVSGGRDGGTEEAYAQVFDTTTGKILSAFETAVRRSGHALVSLADGQLLCVGGEAPLTQSYDEREGAMFDAGTLQTTRIQGLGAASLASGRVLVVGGKSFSFDALKVAEVFEPSSGSLVSTANLAAGCNAASWPEGDSILFAGGSGDSRAVTSFDAVAERFRLLGVMNRPRVHPILLGLPSGRVLIHDDGDMWAQILRPGSRHLSLIEAPLSVPLFAQASPLSGERLLLSGGSNASSMHSKAYVLQPDPNVVAVLDAAMDPPAMSRALPLASGKILLTGGYHGEPPTPQLRATLFDGSIGLAGASTLSSGAMGEVRMWHSMTLLGAGEDAAVLVAGGGPKLNPALDAALSTYASAYVFSPSSGQFEPTGPMTIGRSSHGSALLSTGEVLLTGGLSHPSLEQPDTEVAATEIFSPIDRSFRPGPTMSEPRRNHATTRLGADGRVLITGGCWQDKDATVEASSADIFEPAAGALRPPRGEPGPRLFAAAARLPSGEVLIAGGEVEPNTPVASAELHGLDPQQVSALPPMAQPRSGHSATTLADGRVLLVGGGPGAEVFDPIKRVFSPTGGAPRELRRQHAAALLADGRVMLVGGVTGEPASARVLASAEIYDPASDRFSEAPPAHHARRLAAAARLLDGRVALLGGDDGSPVSSLEVYDPRLGVFVELGGVPSLHRGGVLGQPFVASTVASGEVLVAGPGLLALLDPATLDVEFLESASDGAAGLIPLPTGDTLACGPGARGSSGRPLCLRFDPSTRSLAEPLRHGLSLPGVAVAPTATGDVLLRGALDLPGKRRGAVAVVELAPPGALRPHIDKAPALLRPGEPFDLEGSRFLRWPAREAAGRNWRPEIVPSVVFMPAAGGPPAFGLVMQRGDTKLQVIAPRSAIHGPGWLHVVVMGVASEAVFVQLAPVEQGAACGFDGECATGFCAEGVCCDRRCGSGCESCRARADGGQDGVCAPLAAAQPPRFGCLPESAGDVCGPTGACDGQGACALPPTSTPCSTPSVPSGVCAGGLCVVAPRARCSDDGARVLQPDGSEAPCEPFRCLDGACLTRCRSRLGCAPALRCSEQGDCVAPGVDEGSAGCAACVGSAGPGPWPIVALLVGLRRRRRGAAA